ncbi:hypothetical protein K1W54_19615 [Micromonospora sp. CPCC 205371]|nr:hypothetical protein [Micromonospora sp. CPCC 205371]
MIETTVVLRTPIAEAQAAELERRILFVSPHISSFRLVVRDGTVHSVLLFSAAEPDRAALTTKVNALVETDLVPQPELPVKVVWESTHAAVAHADVYPSLLASGLVSECGEGQVAFAEPLISLLNGLDRRIRDIVVAAFGAAEYRYPTLIRTDVLDRAGYPAAFPQFLMFVTRLHEDLDVYREFQEAHETVGSVAPAVLNQCRNVDYCLPPTMCFHTFAQYRGRTLPWAGLQTVTSCGKSFRHEGRYATTLERLWDFTIRETVFLGGRGEVLDARESLMRTIFDLLEEWGLDGYCQVANDPFFVGADPASKAWSQRLLELKYELRLRLGSGRDLAVGSFNFHDDFFGRSFDITRAGEGPVISGCAGFGLERLLYALLSRHGADPDGWPPAVRDLCAGRASERQEDLRWRS